MRKRNTNGNKVEELGIIVITLSDEEHKGGKHASVKMFKEDKE